MITLHDAVYSVYPNAGVVTGNDVDSLIVLDKDQQVITVNLVTVTSKLAQLQAEEISAQEAQVTARQSAMAKFAALGLTQDEVKALVG